MLRPRNVLVVWSVLALLPLLGGCGDDLEPVQLPGEITLEEAYVGSDACRACHQAEFAAHAGSGHAQALRAVTGGRAPVYPWSVVPNPPAGRTWNDILYVVGGHAWAARFVDRDGYLITGAAAQWNVATQTWSAFDPSAADPEPFTAGGAVTTGYRPVGHQDDLPGSVGTWVEDGVMCERCHGAGAAHVRSQLAADVVRDRGSAACGQCHSLDAQHRITTEGGFLRHPGQYDELRGGAHATLTCVACHDPHASAHYGDAGLVLTCGDCHAGIEVYNDGDGAHTCVNCHMPRATRAAVASAAFRADVRSHVFRIEADAEAEQFYAEGGATFARGYLTTDFACLACHTGRDRAWAEQYAATIHSAGKTVLAGR